MRLLFYSGSLGLGHVTRDLTLASELRKLLPDSQLDWLATPPALQVLRSAGEHVVFQAERLQSLSHEAERTAQTGRLNLARYLARARRPWRVNV
jgi:hypothetical protein